MILRALRDVTMTLLVLTHRTVAVSEVQELTSEEELGLISREVEDRVEMVSSSPRIFVVENFLSREECQFLKDFGFPGLQPSLTIDRETGEYRPDSVRTNSQMYISMEDCRSHPTIRNIVRRMYRLARIPLGHGEQVQIGRYEVGQKYDCHYDSEVRVGVVRTATVIVYLADVEEGGETVFTMGEDCNPLDRCCGAEGAEKPEIRRFFPKEGKAILFYSHDLDGSLNTNAVHCSCPVIRGTKWITQAWFRSTLYKDSPHFPENEPEEHQSEL